jgi:hypothetical protein
MTAVSGLAQSLGKGPGQNVSSISLRLFSSNPMSIKVDKDPSSTCEKCLVWGMAHPNDSKANQKISVDAKFYVLAHA